jgi:hypothetical protein
MTDELILDKKACEKLGLHSEAVYLIEYDLNSKRLIPKTATKQVKDEIVQLNKKAVEIRNQMGYILTFKIRATRHLESSWLIAKERLEEAQVELENVKEKMKSYGFDNVDKRIRIIPVFVREENFESFEDEKAQFLLQFATEHIKYCDRMLEENRVSEPILWRVQKAYEIVNTLSEELKNRDAEAEIKDMASLLDDKTQQVLALKQKLEEEAEKEQKKEKT